MSGEVCRVDYLPESGEVTTMICRTGVKKYLSGGPSATNLAKGRLAVYAFDRQGYRILKLNMIMSIKHGGILYDFRNMHAEAAYRDGNIAEAKELMMPPGEYGVDLYGARTVEAHDSPMYKALK